MHFAGYGVEVHFVEGENAGELNRDVVHPH
jgi:hypothetical protein